MLLSKNQGKACKGMGKKVRRNERETEKQQLTMDAIKFFHVFHQYSPQLPIVRHYQRAELALANVIRPH